MPFIFDDHHTITNNKKIRNFKQDFFKYFTDGNTGTTNSGINYRPIVTAMNAFDYMMAGNKYDQRYYHYHIFFWYIVQLIVMFFFFKFIFDIALKHDINRWIALFGVAYYGLHTVNAETVNYIISRSDSFSTLWMIIGILLYQIPQTRKYHLYLVAMVVGLLTKQTGIMFPPLLFCYILLFEEQITWKDFWGEENRRKLLNTIKKSAPAFILGLGLFVFNQKVMTDIKGYNAGRSKIMYFLTQLHVINTYIANIIFPVGLVVEEDIKLAKSPFEHRVLLGFLVNAILIGISIWCLRNKKYFPITFGIIWFYFALVPTSSFVPRFQIANHHRIYFPFVGWALALTWFLGLKFIENKDRIFASPALKWGIPIACFLLIRRLCLWNT